MTEAEARQLLADILDRFTAGSILHLLSEVLRDAKGESQGEVARECRRQAEAALIVFGIGLDSICPR